jgi:signal transduction histidine kinase/DNA-binding NarL/FixJ family response regulator/GAF domain-containing protein
MSHQTTTIDVIPILFIDDDEAQIELTKLNLKSIDPSLKITSIATPNEALKLIKDHHFDCIVSDYQMPQMNGIQLCAEVRKTNTTPYIIYTGHGSADVASAAFAAGADDYVRKEESLAHYQLLDRRIRHAVQRNRTEQKARRLNNSLKALSDSNRTLVRITDEVSYLNEVCNSIIKDTDYHLVWVGFVENDEAQTVRPVAYAGFDEGYIAGMRITWADTERGRGPTGTAIRTGEVSICHDMVTDPRFEPWREEALKRRYASSIVYPLMESGKPFGAISIYSHETNPWSSEEVELLQQLADDISLGVLSIRERIARRRADEELQATNEELTSVNEELMATQEELKVANDITQEYANRLEGMVDERAAELRLSEERLRAFMESTDEGFAIYDSELRLLDLNRVELGWLLMKSPSGKAKSDFIGRSVTELLPGIEETELYATLDNVLRTGEPKQLEGASFVSDDILILYSVFRVGSGIGVISRDITKWRRMQEALKRAEVVAAVEQMGATVAHDLRGPLGMIVQSVNLIKQDPSLTPRMLHMVEENAVRSLKMIADWRSSTRQIVPQPMKSDLGDLIKHVLEGNPIPSNVEVVTSIGKGLDSILIDPDIIHRVIDNLVRNAVEAMPKGGRLSVNAETSATDLVISVSDTGVGISETSRERIFSPLYTTKSGGMGLGLTYCRRAVEAMGGSIDFESKVGTGATFIVRLPLTKGRV